MLDIEKQLELAKALSAKGDESQAQDMLVQLLKQEPHCAPALFMLGGSYFCTQSFNEAAVIFEQLVLMFPGDGKASTGLYNARWKAGKVTEAVEEIKRFIQSADRQAERETIEAYLRCLLYTSPSPRDQRGSRMPSSA